MAIAYLTFIAVDTLRMSLHIIYKLKVENVRYVLLIVYYPPLNEMKEWGISAFITTCFVRY